MTGWIRWAGIPIAGIIITAVATAIGPLVADKLWNRASLTFNTVVSAPVLTTDGPRRIFSASIRNDGSVPLTNIRGQVENSLGTFETATSQDDKLISPSIMLDADSTRISITAPRMLGGDEFNVTAMMVGVGNGTPKFTIRSDQVQGASEAKALSTIEDPALLAFVTSTATLAMAGAALLWGWKRRRQQEMMKILNEDYRRMTSKD